MLYASVYKSNACHHQKESEGGFPLQTLVSTRPTFPDRLPLFSRNEGSHCRGSALNGSSCFRSGTGSVVSVGGLSSGPSQPTYTRTKPVSRREHQDHPEEGRGDPGNAMPEQFRPKAGRSPKFQQGYEARQFGFFEGGRHPQVQRLFPHCLPPTFRQMDQEVICRQGHVLAGGREHRLGQRDAGNSP